MKLLMAATSQGSPPERQIIRDAVVEQLTSANFRITALGPYSIHIHPCDDSIIDRTHFEIINLPSYSVEFHEDAVQVVMARATTTRILVTLDYADPLFLERLSQTLDEIGVCLSV